MIDYLCAGRQYRSQVEEAYRYETFLSNVKKIELHNTKFQNGQATYWMGVNQFADMVSFCSSLKMKKNIHKQHTQACFSVRIIHYLPVMYAS